MVKRICLSLFRKITENNLCSNCLFLRAYFSFTTTVNEKYVNVSKKKNELYHSCCLDQETKDTSHRLMQFLVLRKSLKPSLSSQWSLVRTRLHTRLRLHQFCLTHLSQRAKSNKIDAKEVSYETLVHWINNCSFNDSLPSALCNHALTTISSYFMIEFLLFTYRRTKRFWFSLGK